MGCLVLIVQHGEKDRLPGDPGLTQHGRRQAEATGNWLRSSHSVTRVVTSPLRRAVETAQPIARLLGLEVTIDDRLRERMNWDDGDAQSIEAFLSEWRQTAEDRSFVPLNGDSSHEAAARFIAALDELAGDDGEVVVVAHGGVTVDALRTILGDEALLAQQPSIIDDGVPCCAVTMLRRTHDRWEAELPSTAHLAGADGSQQRTCDHVAMSSVGREHVDAAVAEMLAVLTPRADVDWHARAGSLEWTCWRTAAHVAHDLLSYAGQLAGRAADGYLPFDLVIAPGAPPRDVLQVVSACGRILSLAVASAEAGPVAWHWGMSDAAGFAAMGVAEALVHTYDITQGLGVDWLPPEPLCQVVVARLLPDAPPGRASEILLWGTGRADLAGHPRVGEWVWRAAL